MGILGEFKRVRLGHMLKDDIMKVAKTAPGALRILWKDKIFLQKCDMSNITKQLEQRGYNFTAATLGMALKDAKFLTRKGSSGKFTYIQKYPYIDEDENNEKSKRN